MALTLDDIKPAAAAPAPVSTPAAPADEFTTQVLEHPVFKLIKEGQLPAVFGPNAIFGEKLPALQKAVTQGGLGFVEAPKSGSFVVFNPDLTSPDIILQSDEAGDLNTIAFDLTQGEGQAAPAAGAPVEGAPPAAAPTPQTPSPTAGLFPAGAEDEMTSARLNTLEPKPPTKRALPSQGIINGLIQRAV